MTDANRGFVKLWANKKERQQYGASLLGGCRERSARLAERTARGTALFPVPHATDLPDARPFQTFSHRKKMISPTCSR